LCWNVESSECQSTQLDSGFFFVRDTVNEFKFKRVMSFGR
jgi:hypothetical protein